MASNLTKSKRKPRGYWNEFANVEKEIRKVAAKREHSGIMPTQDELVAARKSSLSNAIREKHGGYLAVAKRLGLQHSYAQRKSEGYWDDSENIKKELLEYLTKHAESSQLPTQEELAGEGRADLINAIRKQGGFRLIAKTMGLSLSREAKPHGFWTDFENIKNELQTFIEKHGTQGVMPIADDLVRHGFSTLAVTINKYHGGYSSVAKRMGLKPSPRIRPRRSWESFEDIAKEIEKFISVQGTLGVLPSIAELRRAGRHDLVAAYNRFGGSAEVAKHMGLQFSHNVKPAGYWDEFRNLETELKAFISQHGDLESMPTVSDLIKAGRSDLVGGVNRNGGIEIVAKRLGLAVNKKYDGFWANLENVEKELRNFVAHHGQTGIMPTKDALAKARMTSLATAISNFGGSAVVARRLGLLYISPEHVTPHTASSVEHTARAIQPLAESNLLSGAQVMLILRRAGLLDYRNPRILRLNAGLARGKHDEIESAIANLVSGGEEIAVESVAIAESDVLSAEEAEALASVGLDARDKPLNEPLTTSNAPDTQREQTVIRGLSALGELRLPLDHVLQLLTSKILWQAFYKRLYSWYGSLDAAQTVTAEDVQATILSAYPDHAANEFVAEASTLFTYEVEQAVNFAASLADLGWCGPRLRLHQADAARRMAEVLAWRLEVAATTAPSVPSHTESVGTGRLGEVVDAVSNRRFLLDADDPGMGKSASFLAAVCTSDILSVLLVAPKTVTDDTWCGKPNGEIFRCLPHARIVRGMDATIKAQASAQLTFYVLHYEELLNDKAVEKLSQRSFDCLCLDEIHFIKQRVGQAPTYRRDALEKLRACARTAIGLTGTPLVNELSEPMSLLQTLSQHAPQFDYARLSNRRMSDIADVFEAILPHIIRRRKDETLLRLPGCDVRPVPIALPRDLDEKMLAIYQLPRSRATYALVELRKLATIAKLPNLVERAHNARKILILTYLTDDISEKIADYLAEFFPDQVAHINGQTPQADRETRINSFRAQDGVRVLVGTVGTIGVGLTLFDPTADATANEIIFADLPYTFAQFDQGIARLYREGQKHRVHVDVLQTTTTATLRDGSALHTLDERIWELIEGKRELADIAIDGKYDTTDAASKVQKALRRWLKQAREIGVEPLAVERRRAEQTSAEKWRGEIGRLRALSAVQADETFADPEFTHGFLEHLKTSSAAKLSHQWLRGRLGLLLRSDLTIVDMGCGLNPFADLRCHVIGLDRHDLSGVLRGKMENPALPDKSADILIYSLSLYGTPSDLLAYFHHAARILRGGGHLFIVEPESSFTPEGLVRFVNGLRQFGFELVGSTKELRGEDETLLKAMHLTLTGEMAKPSEAMFERK